MKRITLMTVAVAMAMAMGAAQADDLVKIWTGKYSSVWDTSALNWSLNEEECAFAAGDNVKIDDTSTTTEITASNVKPKVTEINTTRDLSLNGNVFASGSGTLIKNGTGTLTLTPATTWNDSNGNLLTNVVINGGVVKGGVRAAYTTYSDPKNSTITINNGGTLWCNWHCDTGIASGTTGGGKQTIIVNDGGTLDLYTPTENSNIGCHPLGSLILNGGTLKYGRGWGGAGIAEIHTLLSFAGTTPYELNFDNTGDRGYGQYIALRENGGNRADLTKDGMTEIRVADITGDDQPDVKLGIPFMKNSSWTGSREGYRKTGAGTLQITTNCTAAVNGTTTYKLDGDIRVEEGVLDLAHHTALDLTDNHTVYVSTNAELKVSAIGALGTSQTASPGPNIMENTTFYIDRGTFKLANPAKNATDQTYIAGTYDANNFVGSLILDHATFDYSAIKTGANDSLGWLTLGKLFKVIADEPYVLSTTGIRYPGIGLRPFSRAFDERTGSDAWLKCYQSEEMNGTEICIDKIEGNTGLYDLFIDAPFMLTRMPNWSMHGGFVKTGTGTLALNNEYSGFQGDVTVREGKLLLGTSNSSCKARTWNNYSILGQFESSGHANPTDAAYNTGRTITVEDTGVLEFNARNFWANYNVPTQIVPNARYVVKNGGTLKFNYASFNPIPNLIVEDGNIDLSDHEGDGYSDYGNFRVIGPFTVRGTKPLTVSTQSKQTETYHFSGMPICYAPRTEFNVADVTGDAKADMTLAIPLITPATYANYNVTPTGFRKTGAGTLRYSARRACSAAGLQRQTAMNIKGDTDVEEGALMIDGDALFQSDVKVAAGAYVGGTGTVQSVTLASGAKVQLREGAKGGLKVTGDLTVSGPVTVDIAATTALDKFRAAVFDVTGTVTGGDYLTSATVTINGEPTDKIRLGWRGKKLVASKPVGLYLIVR